MESSMLNEMKQKSMKAVMPWSVLLIVIGLILFVVFGKDFITYVKGPVDFEALSMDEINDQFVKFEYKFNYGTFAEETTTRTRNGVKVSEGVTSRMNVILIGGVDHYFEEETDGFHYIGASFGKEHFNKLNQVDQNVNDFFTTYEKWYYDYTITNEELLGTLKDSYEFSGQIVKMNKEIYSYYKDFFMDEGYSEEEFEKYCSPYYIKVGSMKNGSFTTIILFNALAAVLVLIGIVLIIRVLTGGFQKSLLKQLKNKGEFALSHVESDYARTTDFCKGYKVGREYMFGLGATSKVYPLSEFLWAYVHKTTHKTYFITTGKTFAVNVCMDDGKSFMINAKNEAHATGLLEKLSNLCPGLIVGYSDEAANIYRKDRNQMIRYREERKNQPENTANNNE